MCYTIALCSGPANGMRSHEMPGMQQQGNFSPHDPSSVSGAGVLHITLLPPHAPHLSNGRVLEHLVTW